MDDSSGTSRAGRPALAIVPLILGGALTLIAARAPVTWGMIQGSGVDLGGDAGERWLMNLTEGLIALGVIIGGRLVDRGKLLWTAMAACLLILVGTLIGWSAPDSPGAVLFGLGVLASVGGGLAMAVAVVVVATGFTRFRGAALGLAYLLGLVGVELIWGSASMAALSRGPAWVLGQVAWIGPLSGAVGAALLLLGRRLVGTPGDATGGRLPLWGPPPTSRSLRSTESITFLALASLAFLAAFSGLMSQRAGAALSVMGLPDGSMATGVMVGFTFAVSRSAGAFVGGLVHDVVGPRLAGSVTAFGLAATLVILSRHVGYENPWHPLIGSIGVASGMGLAIVPVACVHFLGRETLGYHFGMLYLAVALGNVAALPLHETIQASPQGALLITAALCIAVGVVCFWLVAPRSPKDGGKESSPEQG